MRFIKSRIWYFIIPVLIIIFTPSNSFSQDKRLSKEDKKKYKLGMKYSNRGEDELALEQFLEVYNSAPENIDNLYFIAITYNDRLEDYTNAYKYGNILLSVLNKRLKKLNPREDKKKYEKAKDLTDEIELLVLVAEPKANTIANEINNDTIVAEEATAVTEQGSDEPSTEESEIDKNEVQNQEEYYDTPASGSNSNENLSAPFLGFSFINLVENNGKDDIIETVNREYEREKNKQTLDEKGYRTVLSENNDRRFTFESFNANYLYSLKKSEYDLLQAVYQYNVSLFEKDSIGQIITALYGRNDLLNGEIASLNWYLDQFKNSDQDSLINDEYIGCEHSIIIGRYLIEKSLTDDDTKRLLYEIKGSLKDNADFSNPQIISVVMFINSFSDNKYLYLVTKTIDDGKVDNDNVYNKGGDNLEVYTYRSSQFNNITTYKKLSFSDLGLKANEIKIIQGMSQTANKKMDFSALDTTYRFSNENLQYFAEQRLNFLSGQREENQVIIDSLIETINDTLELRQDRFYMQKEYYESKISEYKSYINYLILEKEADSKSPKEQYSNMADEIVDLAIDNLGYSLTKLNRVNTYPDTTMQPMQIKFVMDTILLKPNIYQYKVLSLSKIKFDNSDDTYFAIDIGFEMNFSFPENIPDNETVSYDAVQAYTPKQNESEYGEQTDYIPPVGGSFKILSIEGVSILQDRYNKQWKILEDNPSSYTSYMMFQEEEGWRLPTYNELRSIISYLASNKNKLDQLGWADNGVIYLSSDSQYDNRNNKLFKGLKLTGTTLQEQNVQGGDEVYLIVVKN